MSLPKFTFSKSGNFGQFITVLVGDFREKTIKISAYSNSGTLLAEKQYTTADFSSASDAIQKFKSENTGIQADALVISVPGPVIDGISKPARLPWEFHQDEIKKQTDIVNVLLLNDLEAYAYALSSIGENNVKTLHKSENEHKGNVAILAAGNGLGEAGLFFDGTAMHPFATEGGHCEFSPRTEVEVEFYQFLNKIYGIVSWENVLSKNGLFNIFRFLRDVKRHEVPQGLDFENNPDGFIKQLLHGALHENSTICKLTLYTYIEFLAREANSLVLKLKATGGLFIGGEILTVLEQIINKEKFYNKFLMSDKMEHLLKDVSIYLITEENMIQKGAFCYAVN